MATNFTQPRDINEFMQLLSSDIGIPDAPPVYGGPLPVGQAPTMFRAREIPQPTVAPKFRAQPNAIQGRNPDAPASVDAFKRALGLPVDDQYGNRFDGVTARNVGEPNPADPLSYLPELQAEDQALIDNVMSQLGVDAEQQPLFPDSVVDQPVMNIGGEFTPQQPRTQSQMFEEAVSNRPDMQFLRDRGGIALALDTLAESDAASRGVAAGPRLQDSRLFQGTRPEEIEAMRLRGEGQEANIRGMGTSAIQRGLEFSGGAMDKVRAHRLSSKRDEVNALSMLAKLKAAMQPKPRDPLDVAAKLSPYADRLDDDKVDAIINYSLSGLGR